MKIKHEMQYNKKNLYYFLAEGKKQKIWQMASYKNNAVALEKEVIYLFTYLFPVLPMEQKPKYKRGQR